MLEHSQGVSTAPVPALCLSEGFKLLLLSLHGGDSGAVAVAAMLWRWQRCCGSDSDAEPILVGLAQRPSVADGLCLTKCLAHGCALGECQVAASLLICPALGHFKLCIR